MNMDSIVIYYQKKIVQSYSPLGSCYVDIGHKAESHKLLSFSSQISVGLTGLNPILSSLLTPLPSWEGNY